MLFRRVVRRDWSCKIGTLTCNTCGASYQAIIHGEQHMLPWSRCSGVMCAALSEEIDVFCEWIDAFEALNERTT
jgi:transcription elongation factor Elf1